MRPSVSSAPTASARVAYGLAREAGGEPLVDGAGPEGALVDEGAVALDERGAGQDALPGVLGVLDAADADQGDPVADARVEAAQHLQGARLQRVRRRGRRSPATRAGSDVRPRPSRAMVVFVAMMPSRPSSTARSATASTSSSARSGAILTSSGTRRAGDRAVGGLAHGGEQRAQRLGGLEVAQAGGVGRGDVDDEVVGVRGEPLGGGHVVGDGLVLGDDLGLADVDADDGPEDRACGRARRRRPRPREPSLLKPMRLISARSGTSRNSRFLGLPGCGSPGDRADLDVVEAEHRHAVDGDRVLVEAGGEPEGAVHPQPERLGAQLLVAGRERGGDEGAQHGDAGGEPDPAEGQVVGLLGVHPLEDQVGRRACTWWCPREASVRPHEEGDTVSGVPLAGC